MEKVALDTELLKLDSLYRAWRNERAEMQFKIRDEETRIRYIIENIKAYKEALKVVEANPQKHFVIDVFNVDKQEWESFESKDDAGRALKLVTASVCKRKMGQTEVAKFRGMPLYADMQGDVPQLFYEIGGVKKQVNVLESENEGVCTSLSYYTTRGFSDDLKKTEERLENAKATKAAFVEESESGSWKHTERYQEVSERLAVLNKKLQQSESEKNIAKLEDAIKTAVEARDDDDEDAKEVQEALEAIKELHDDHDLVKTFTVIKKSTAPTQIAKITFAKDPFGKEDDDDKPQLAIKRREVKAKSGETAEQFSFF